MILRDATHDDVAAVVALEQELFGLDAWSSGSVAEELTGPRRHGSVAMVDEELAGYAVTMRSDDVVDLQRIAVRPAYRRSGIGSALLAAAVDRARAEGAHRMLLEVSATNTGALGFYAREGFVEIDRRRRYYRDGSDAIVLRRPLGSAMCGGGRMAR